MLRKLMVLGLVLSSVFLNGPMALAQKGAEPVSPAIEKIRETISRVGTGETAKVSVKLRNKAVMKGYVVRVVDGGFVLGNSKGGPEQSLTFSEVESVKKNSSVMRKVVTWTLVGVGGVAAVLLIGAKATSGGIRSH